MRCRSTQQHTATHRIRCKRSFRVDVRSLYVNRTMRILLFYPVSRNETTASPTLYQQSVRPCIVITDRTAENWEREYRRGRRHRPGVNVLLSRPTVRCFTVVCIHITRLHTPDHSHDHSICVWHAPRRTTVCSSCLHCSPFHPTHALQY